jgi:dienelactone hydrolase
VRWLVLPVVITAVPFPTLPATAPRYPGPDTVLVQSGGLALRALLWQPSGAGPFPAVLFNHGSYSTGAPLTSDELAVLGPVFARRGYVFLFLCRQGIGLSSGEGTADGDLMSQAFATEGQDGRNRVQLELLQGAELNQAASALAYLRALPQVDPGRVAVIGHSFGGSLTLLLAQQDTSIRAAVVFSGAALSWNRSPQLRTRLLDAVRRMNAPVFLIHAANDYSTESGKALAREMQARGKPHRLRIYPPNGHTPREGHAFVFQGIEVWERDVFDFLDRRLNRERVGLSSPLRHLKLSIRNPKI